MEEDKLPSPGSVVGGETEECVLLLDIVAAVEAGADVGTAAAGAAGAAGVSTAGKRRAEVGWELSELAVPDGRSGGKLS